MQIVNSSLASSKFLHLKFLSIVLISGSYFHQDYDFLSLVHFFDASPSLETFRLYVSLLFTLSSKKETNHCSSCKDCLITMFGSSI